MVKSKIKQQTGWVFNQVFHFYQEGNGGRAVYNPVVVTKC